MRTPTDAPVLTNSRQNHSVHTGVAGASVTPSARAGHWTSQRGRRGCWRGGRGDRAGGGDATPFRAHVAGGCGGHPTAGAWPGWGQVGSPGGVFHLEADRASLSPECDCFHERNSRQAGSLSGPRAPHPCPVQAPAPPRPGCLRAPGTCPSAGVPRRWCDCFSAVIFNRLYSSSVSAYFLCAHYSSE